MISKYKEFITYYTQIIINLGKQSILGIKNYILS